MLTSSPCTPDKPAQTLSILCPTRLRGGQSDGSPSSPLPAPLPEPKLGCGEKASKEQKDQRCLRWQLVARSHAGSPAAWGPVGCAQTLEGCSNLGRVPMLTQNTTLLGWGGTWQMLG